MYTYKAKIIKVKDGDTFVADVDIGFNLKMKMTLRVKDIDTPEIYHPCSDLERIHGEKATAEAIELLENKEVIINTYKMELYNRYLADIIIDDKKYSDIMKERGFAKKPREEYMKKY